MKQNRVLSALARAAREQRIGTVSAVLAAAGDSVRFGRPKPFVKIGEKHLFEYSLEALLSSEYVAEVILAVRKEDLDFVQTLLRSRFPDSPVRVCIGGKSRDESVMRAFLSTSRETKFVAFHDAARPLITPKDIDRVIEDAFLYGAASAAAPVSDSLKRVKDFSITEDVDRDGLYATSTPQVFFKDIYEVARAICAKDGFSSTDDNAYVTHAGFDVRVTEVFQNPKLTYPGDLAGIERELLARGKNL